MTVSDVGTELNPLQVVSQDEGAAIMGLGHSQMEQLLLDEHGVIRNLGALDYRIPTFKDVPLELVTRGRREPRRARSLRLQGDQRGRPAVHGRGARRRGLPCHGRRHPRPAADPRTGLERRLHEADHDTPSSRSPHASEVPHMGAPRRSNPPII